MLGAAAGWPRPGVGHDLARIEHRDVRGGYDPRFVSRRLVPLHVVGDDVVVALDTVLGVDTQSGPDRADGVSIDAAVEFDRARPIARLRVREMAPSGRTTARCRTALRFDGQRFVARDPSCSSRWGAASTRR